MGYISTTAQLFTVPPNVTGFLVVIITAHYSDKVKNRGWFIVGGTLIGICGYTYPIPTTLSQTNLCLTLLPQLTVLCCRIRYIMLLVSDANAVKYAGTFLIATGVFQASPMLMVGHTSPIRVPRGRELMVSRAGSRIT